MWEFYDADATAKIEKKMEADSVYEEFRAVIENFHGIDCYSAIIRSPDLGERIVNVYQIDNSLFSYFSVQQE